MEKLLKVNEVAEYLGLRPQTLYNMVSQGRIPYLKAGKALRFRKEDIDKWLEVDEDSEWTGVLAKQWNENFRKANTNE